MKITPSEIYSMCSRIKDSEISFGPPKGPGDFVSCTWPFSEVPSDHVVFLEMAEALNQILAERGD